MDLVISGQYWVVQKCLEAKEEDTEKMARKKARQVNFKIIIEQNFSFFHF